jgi:hypothetical protein
LSRRRDLLTELGWVLVGSVALISALDALTLGGAFAEWITLLAAAVFIAAPLLALQRRRRQRTQKEPATGPAGQDATPEDAAPDPLAFGASRLSLTWAAISVALLAALFPIGFHIWHGVIQGEQAHPAWSNYARWPLEAEGRPADLRAPGVYAWTLGQDLFIWCEATTDSARQASPEVTLQVTPPDALTLTRRRGATTAQATADGFSLTCPPTRGGADFTLQPAPSAAPRLTLRAATPLRIGPDPNPIPPDNTQSAQSPATSTTTTTYTLSASAWWVLWLVLNQVLMVALPEEVFYRGYVQPTLKQALGGSQGVKGWRAMAALLVITSALFALGHVAVYWHWTRLMVFFPSLLFGWLRERTGGVLASTLFHAACNCAVELARVHYF